MRSYLKIGLVTIVILTLTVSLVLAKSSKNQKIAWLGVTTTTVNDDLADDHDLPIDFGALILDVISDSPAEEAGLQEDDIIISFNRKKVYDVDDLTDYVEDSEIGDKVNITVYRDDRKIHFDITLEGRSSRRLFDRSAPSYRKGQDIFNVWTDEDSKDYSEAMDEYKEAMRELKSLRVPKSPRAPKAPMVYDFGNFHNGTYVISDQKKTFLGVYLTDMSDQLGDYFGVKKGRGALVTEIVEDSPAENVGLSAGDVIVAIDNEKVTDENDVVDILSDYEPEDKVTITVLRNKSKKEFSVVLEQNDNYVDGTYYYNAPDISVNIPKMRGIHLGNFYEDDYEEDILEAIEDYLDALADYQDEIEDLDGEIDRQLKKELNKYFKEIEKFKQEYDEDFDEETDRKVQRAMKKLERELKLLKELMK